MNIYVLCFLYMDIEYEPRFDRYKVYQNLANKNQYVIVQDYINWKHNSPRVDTALIDDYSFIRSWKYLKIMNIKGDWIRYNEQEKVLDTISIK